MGFSEYNSLKRARIYIIQSIQCKLNALTTVYKAILFIFRSQETYFNQYRIYYCAIEV